MRPAELSEKAAMLHLSKNCDRCCTIPLSNTAADVDCDYDEAGAIGSVLEKLNPRPSPQTDCMITIVLRPVRPVLETLSPRPSPQTDCMIEDAAAGAIGRCPLSKEPQTAAPGLEDDNCNTDCDCDE